MKVAIFGASGNIGQRIADEALRRGHSVTAVVRDPTKIPPRKNLSAMKGDVTVIEHVTAAASGQDAVISAVNFPGNKDGVAMFSRATRSLLDGLKVAKVKRMLMVGGAGSLEVAPGKQLVDAPDFPEAWKGAALAHRDAFKLLREDATLDWTYVSPAAVIEPGERTGKFRLGTDQLLTDANGQSRISMEDFAVAVIDEMEKPRHIRRRFTLAY
jgi:putative NADH-flavin reductase